MIIKKTTEIENKILDISLELKVSRIIEKNISNLCKMPFSSFSEDLDALYKNNAEIMFEILKAYEKTIVSSEERKVFSGFKKEIYQNSKVIDKRIFETNPYYKAVRCEKDVTSGRFKLTTRILPRYTVLAIDEDSISSSIDITIPCLGIFKDNIPFLSLMEEDEIWMSITPMEINTMEKSIQEASGDVLTFGCGLGYFAFMASEKEDVNNVTIVESSDDVISLFTNYILPQFPHKEKIHIVKADAFEYAKELSDGVFDYCFVDIWMSDNDIKTYLKMRNICSKFNVMNVSYWIERQMFKNISQYVKLILVDEYYEKNMIKNYIKQRIDGLSSVGIHVDNQSRKIMEEFFIKNSKYANFYYFANKLKDARINTVEDIQFYLNPENWL